MKKKSVLVTGGAGFIGSCLVGHLNYLGIEHIVIADHLGTTEKWKNLVGKKFKEVLHKDHLFDWLERNGEEIGAIFHLGACSDTTETNADYLLENNTRYSMRLFEFALERHVRFIYASSASTYGDGSLGFSDTASIEELQPLNMYGYSKHLFDLWLSRQGYLDKVVGLKFFNVFGPNEYHKGKMTSALVKMLPQALSEQKIRLFKSNDPRFEDGGQIRDFIYVKDVVRMTATFLSNNLTGIFNVGLGQESTWNDLAQGLMKAIDKPCRIEYIEMPKELVGKYQNYTLADMTLWKKHNLPLPQYTLEEGVVDYLRNYLLEMRYL